MRVRIRSYFDPIGERASRTCNRGEGSRFSESRAGRRVREGGARWHKLSKSTALEKSSSPLVCAYSPLRNCLPKIWELLPVALFRLARASWVTFLFCKSFLPFCDGIHVLIGERERGERESRISLLDRARMQVPFVLIFYLAEEKSSLLVPIRKSAGKKRVFQYLPFLPCWALLTRGACARFFRVASRGSLTFELSNRPDAVSEYCPVIAPGYGSSDAMRRDAILRSKLIQSRDSLNSSIIIQIWIWHLPVKYSLSC